MFIKTKSKLKTNKKLFKGVLICIAVFAAILFFADHLLNYSLPQVQEALGFFTPDHRISDSPLLRLSEDEYGWPPVVPPPPHEAKDMKNPSAMELYEVATGEVSLISSYDPSQWPIMPRSTSTPPFAGLLDPGQVIESVIGTDDRTRITATTVFPWRTICKLYMTAADGTHWVGSGAVIDGNHILTAGHCVYMHDHGGWVSSIKVIPGLNSSYMPYYYSWATYMRSYTGWTVGEDWNHDWAVVTLDRNIGNFVGWMGRITTTNLAWYLGNFNIAGYPCDLCGCVCLYHAYNSGCLASSYKHWYRMDTAGGMSGCPVWYLTGGNRYIATVHAYGVDGTGCNSGTRLNQDKYDRIFTWLNADPPIPDKADLIDDGQSYSGFSPTTVVPGQTSFHAWCDVRNIGTASSGGFYVAYYASTNTTITTADRFIGKDYVSSISPFAYGNSDWNGTYPSSPAIPNGQYYVGWIIDSDGDVSEFNEGNNTAYKTAYKLTICNIPATPSSITYPSSDCDGNFTVSWTTASGATSYELQRATNPSFTGATTVYNGSSTSYPQSGLGVGTYYYRVRAKNSCGSSGWRNGGAIVVSRPPSILKGITYPSSDCDGNFPVNWSAVSGATSYELQRATNPRFTGATTVYNGASTSYPQSGLGVGTYYYRVRAKNSCGSSGWRGGGAIVVSRPPGRFSYISPTDGATGVPIDADLDWSDSSYAIEYDVYFGTTSPPPKVTTVTSSSHDPGTLNFHTTYHWKIVAKNNCGETPGPEWHFTTSPEPTPCILPIICDETAAGEWTGECTSDHRPGRYAKYYTFSGSAGQEVVIDLTSSEDTYLYLIDPSGNVEAQDDDGGAGTNSRIARVLSSSGTYKIEATTYYSGKTGSFDLTLGCPPDIAYISTISYDESVSGDRKL